MHLYAFVQAAEIWVKTESRSRGYLHMSQATLWQAPGGSVKKCQTWERDPLHNFLIALRSGGEFSPDLVKDRKTGRKRKIWKFSPILCALWRAANSLFLSKVETRQKCHTFIESTRGKNNTSDIYIYFKERWQFWVDSLKVASSSTVISDADSGSTRLLPPGAALCLCYVPWLALMQRRPVLLLLPAGGVGFHQLHTRDITGRDVPASWSCVQRCGVQAPVAEPEIFLWGHEGIVSSRVGANE